MTDTPLVQESAPLAPRPARRRWLPIAIVVVVLAAIAGGATWWLVAGRATTPDWDRIAALDLPIPAGDAFQSDTPWVMLHVAPLRPGETNTLTLSLQEPKGTPVPSDAASPRIAALTAQPLSGDAAPAETLALQAQPDGTLVATAPLDRPGWWRLSVQVEGAPQPADVFLMLPDPNINGPRAVHEERSSPEAEALFQRGLAATTALQTVRFTQWISDALGNAAVSEHAVTAGGNGQPPGFTYRAAGGMEAVVIGSTRWILLPANLGWTEQDGAVTIPPSQWGDEYLGATGFTNLGEETIDGEPCQIVGFVVPEMTEPYRQTVAWYAWWVGTETGQVRQEIMVSRLHYMHNQFGDFNAPLTLTPPVATPGAGTPVP
jgi:hypothetical protein